MIKEKKQFELKLVLASPLHSGVRPNELEIGNSLVAIQACWREKKGLIANIIIKDATGVMTRRCSILDEDIIFEAPEKPNCLGEKYEKFVKSNLYAIEELITRLCDNFKPIAES